jgi:hypothetical protein
MINVVSKTCEHPCCQTQARFGFCGQAVSHCAEHKSDYMITKPKTRTCEEDDCKDAATHGEKEPNYCETHAKPTDQCWLVTPCNKCGRKDELLDRDRLCYFACSLEKFNDLHKRHQKVKESTMVRYLRENLKLPAGVTECLADKIVDSMCNKYRPDLAFDCVTHIVVAECDENQHKGYNWQGCASNRSLQDAEERRMHEIFVAFGLLPTIFIRWNPDYFTVNGTECKKYNQAKRLELLQKWVQYCIKIPVEKLKQEVEYIQLFYDDFEETNTTFKLISGL